MHELWVSLKEIGVWAWPWILLWLGTCLLVHRMDRRST
jgi:cytochrome c-type biogenesis protein CcmH/NrfF